MKLDAITMDREQARQAYLAYRAAVREDTGAAPEDAMLARGYRQLALGRTLIDIEAAMRRAGLGNDGWPRLAITRADAATVRVKLRGDREVEMWCGTRKDQRWSWRGIFDGERLPKDLQRQVDEAREDGRKRGIRPDLHWFDSQAAAAVPRIPPQLRPEHALVNYHVVFEVEKWEPTPRVAPRDPALLRHIGGPLYAVLAVWDLTELERTVIAATRLRPT